MNRLRHGAIHQQQQCDVSPEIPDIRIVPDEHSSAPSDSCPPSLRASQADISGSSNNSNAEEQKILLNPSGLSPMYSSLQINDVDSDRENSELLTPPGTPFRDRAGSGSKWAKVRTSVKVAGAVQSTMRKRTRKGSPLVRQDSFLKRFSMRHAGETNNEEAVYDNDEERAWHQRFVVNPDENFMFFWLGVITVAVLYNLWTSIAREGFREIQRGYEPIWLSMDALCDLLYLCDIAVQLRTGYLEKGLIVCNTKKLACHYIFAKYFVLDLLSLLPLDLLQFYIGIHPIIRFPRFIKIYRSHRFAYMVETRTIYPNMWRVVNLSHVLFLGSHWFAAFYFMISKAEGFRGNWGYPTPEGEFASVARQYLKSLYWSTLTLTTIGDLPPPESNWDWLRKMPPHRYVFTIVSYLIGVFVFATIVGQVGNVITNRNASRQEFERLLDSAKAYMRNHNVPANMQRRVQRWYDYAWSRGRMNGGGDINSLGLLPDKLKTELALHVNLGTLKKVTIFQECEPEFLHDLVLKMRAFIFTPGDLICRKGEIAREMFIIADGLLEVISDQGEVLTQMTSGDFFGEIGILNLDGGVNRRTADVRSVGYSELFVLSREDVLSALKDHPEAEARIKAFGRMRLQEIEENRRKRKLQDQIKDNNEINTGSTQCSPVHKMVNSSADLLHKVLKLGRKQSFSADNISVLEKIGGSPDKLCENDLSMGSIFQKVIALGKQAKSQTQLDCLNERTLMAPPKLNGEKPSQSEGNLTAITEKIATKESIGRTPPRQTTKGAWTLLKGSPAGGQPKVINNQGNTYQAVHTDDDVETEQQEAMQLGEVMTKSPSNPDTMAITVEMEESDLENNSGSVPLLLTVDNSNQDDANLNLVPMNSTALDISLPMVERQQSQALSRDSTATSAISGTTGDGVNNLSQAGLWEKQEEINSSAKSVSFDNPLYSETSTHAAALASQQRAYSDEAICKHTHLSVQSHETLGPIAQACCTPIHVNSGSHAQPAQPPSNPDLHCKHDLDLATLNDPDGNIDISNSNLGNDPQLELIPFPMMPALTNGDLPHGCSMRDAATSDHESHCSQENTTIDSTNNSMTDVTPTSPAVDDVTSPVESSFPPPALPPPPSSAVLVAPEPAEHSSKTDNPSSSHNNNTSKHNCSSHNRDGKNDHPRPELNRSNAIEMSGDSMTDAEPYVSREGGNDVNRDAPFADVMGAMNAILQRKLAEYHQFYEDRIRTLEADNDLKSDTIQQLQQQVKVLQESLAATVSSTPQSDTDEC